MKRLIACAFLFACANENDPATWVRRIDDPKRRIEAIERLEKFQDHEATIEPLTNAYATSELDANTRHNLIASLAAMNDVRAAPAFVQAFEVCDADAEIAAKAVTALSKSGASGAHVPTSLFKCFAHYQASTGSIAVANALHDAIMAVKDASYPAKAAAMLEAPVNPADSFDAHGAHRINDQLEIWQKTALEILIATPEPRALHVLVNVLMTRDKRTLWPLARAALATNARAAVPVIASALDGSNADFVKLRAGWERDDGYVANLIDALADTSLDEARDVLLKNAKTITLASNRAVLAQSLQWFPRTDAAIDTFEKIYDTLPPTSLERSSLLESAGELFDVKLFAWALEQGGKSGTGDSASGAKAGAIQSAIRLMQPGDEPRVLDAIDVLVNKSGLSPMERSEIGRNLQEVYAAASSALTQCKVDVACHVAILREAIPTASHAQWKAIKAAMTCGMLGNDATRKDLVALLATVKNPGARLAIARAVNQLAPKGDVASADALDAIVATELLPPDDVIARVSRMIRARVR